MIPVPKPRGFWDYGLFALGMAGLLVFLFWLESSRVGWSDVAVALVAALVLVFGIILARRREKAKWIARPTWRVSLFAMLGAYVMIFGAVYVDLYLFHSGDVTPRRLRRDGIAALTALGGMLWQLLRRRPRNQQSSGLNGSSQRPLAG